MAEKETFQIEYHTEMLIIPSQIIQNFSLFIK